MQAADRHALTGCPGCLERTAAVASGGSDASSVEPPRAVTNHASIRGLGRAVNESGDEEGSVSVIEHN
jgi:hypothetical protein